MYTCSNCGVKTESVTFDGLSVICPDCRRKLGPSNPLDTLLGLLALGLLAAMAWIVYTLVVSGPSAVADAIWIESSTFEGWFGRNWYLGAFYYWVIVGPIVVALHAAQWCLQPGLTSFPNLNLVVSVFAFLGSISFFVALLAVVIGRNGQRLAYVFYVFLTPAIAAVIFWLFSK